MGWATAAPYIATGIGALGQGLMGHGGTSSPSGYPQRGTGAPIFPELLNPYDTYAPNVIGKALANIEHMGGVATSRAQEPILLSGTEVQQPGWYGGAADDTWQGGMAMPVGVSGVDQAWMRPSLQGRPGIRFGGPDPTKKMLPGGVLRPEEQAKYMFPGAPRYATQDETYFKELGSQLPTMEGLRQPPQTPLQSSGDIEGIYSAMKLLGVERDPMGNLSQGADWPHFTGALTYGQRKRDT
jgi:hypothetical protein